MLCVGRNFIIGVGLNEEKGSDKALRFAVCGVLYCLRVPRSLPSYQMTHAGHPVEVTYKDVKHLRLRVLPPEGRVAASVPFGVGEETVRAFIDRQGPWIAEAQQRIRMARPVVEPLVDGGRARLWGRWREVRIVEGARAGACLEGDAIRLSGDDEATRRRSLENLYRRELAATLPALLDQWQHRVGKRATQVKLRRMTSRWGTCNTVSGAITLNSALAEHPSTALEYVLVHELVHLWERGHGAEFRARMDQHVPDWRQRRAALRGHP